MPSRVSNDGLDPDTFDTLIAVQTRNMLRLTAKSTQFGHRTFTSWLIESAGTVPIKRRKDYNNNEVDNSQAMDRLMDVRCAHIVYIGNLKVQLNLTGTRTWRCSLFISGGGKSLSPHYCPP